METPRRELKNVPAGRGLSVPCGSQVAEGGEAAWRGGNLEPDSGGRETRLRARSRFLQGQRQLGRDY